MVLAAVALVASPAAAETAAEKCIAAAERGQSLRDEGKLVASRAELIACANDACPAVVRRECARWLAEVDQRIPSIVISVKDRSGRDVVAPSVTVDGMPLATSALGRAYALDPGPHRLRAVHGSHPPAEESIVLREREQARVVNLVIRTPETKAEQPLVSRKRTVPTLSWILGGVALVGAGGFAYFWADGMGTVGDLERTCKPFCTPDQIDEARTPLDIARVSLGVGVVAAVAAVVVYLAQPTTASPRRSGMRPFVYEF